MPITYRASLRTARLQAVLDDIGSAGKVKIRTAGGATLLAEFTLPAVSGSVSGDVLTLDCDPDIASTGVATGTAADGVITQSNDTVVASGLTVGVSGSGPGGTDPDLVIDNDSIANGQSVSLLSVAITHPS